jgi:histidinol-phosphate phosphatase family protein
MSWGIDDTWTLFLDRDGVINRRILSGYVTSIEEFEFLDDVPQTIASFSQLFRFVFVVTNQQGIGKGLMSESNLVEIHRYMEQKVEEMNGRITRTYYAPGIVSPDNQLRKPKPGMALLAQRQHKGVDFQRSIMVGDTDSDIIFGKNLGMKTVRIATEHEKIGVDADLTVERLVDFLNWMKPC